MTKTVRVALSLGSNLGKRSNNIDIAIDLLGDEIDVKKVSHLLATKAILKNDAPKEWDIDFLNCVLIAETTLEPQELLVLCKKIEKQLGRDFSAPIWSPRVIDVDILNYGDQMISTEELTIPHKEIANRQFLVELNDEISDLHLKIGVM